MYTTVILVESHHGFDGIANKDEKIHKIVQGKKYIHKCMYAEKSISSPVD